MEELMNTLLHGAAIPLLGAGIVILLVVLIVHIVRRYK